ncbi:MAG: ABC transporter ATP-binding protein [Candidatus Coatesbacteria bacterium]|nr:ABC transporter ATP-binding protein [Candidatus Coatesbacteria bacterium]
MKLLEVENLETCYGNLKVLKGITFSIEKGQIAALLGANGAGKSTTLKTISGLLKPLNGSIMLENEDIARLETHKIIGLGITHVPEGRFIFSTLSVDENLEIGAHIINDKKRVLEIKEEVYNMFPRLRERYKQLGGTLSGGEQQMLAIGRGLMANPKILLLDEPSLGLSPKLFMMIMDKIVEIRDKGVTILIVEQNAKAALKISDKGFIMETGRIVKSGTANELLNDPVIQQAYLGKKT